MTDDRRSKIMSAYEAGAAKERAAAEKAQAEAERRATDRDRAKQDWVACEAALKDALNDLNESLAVHGKGIYAWYAGAPEGNDLAKLRYGLDNRDDRGSLQRLAITLSANGTVHYLFGTKNMSPAGHGQFAVTEGTKDRWTEVFLDFLEANAPK